MRLPFVCRLCTQRHRRHSTAVALSKFGNDLSTISHYLGHASLNRTNRYVKVDLEMKRNAIARVKAVPRQSRTQWSKDPHGS
jgi:site-specific recombinase XerD